MLAGSELNKKRYLRQVQDSQFYTSLHKLFTTLRKPSSLANDILVEALTYQMFYQLVTEYPDKTPHANTKAQHFQHN